MTLLHPLCSTMQWLGTLNIIDKNTTGRTKGFFGFWCCKEFDYKEVGCACRVEIPDLAYEPVIEILAGLPEQHAPLRWAEADGWQGVIACASPDTKGSAANGSSGMREHPSSQVLRQFHQQ